MGVVRITNTFKGIIKMGFLHGFLFTIMIVVSIVIWGGLLWLSTLIVVCTDGMTFFEIISNVGSLVRWVGFVVVFIFILSLPFGIVFTLDGGRHINFFDK